MSQLKKSPVVYTMAILFMIAPFGNVALSLLQAGLPNWASPSMWVRAWLYMIPASNKLFLTLTFIAGCLLWRARRSSWIMALVALAVTTGFNIYNGFFVKSTFPSKFPFAELALIPTAAVFVVLYYFRYPYLERRESLTGVSPRTAAQLDVKVPSLGTDVSARLENISRSGCRLKGGADFTKKIEGKETLTLALREGLQVEARIIRVDQDSVGVKFENLSKEQKDALKTFVQENS